VTETNNAELEVNNFLQYKNFRLMDQICFIGRTWENTA